MHPAQHLPHDYRRQSCAPISQQQAGSERRAVRTRLGFPESPRARALHRAIQTMSSMLHITLTSFIGIETCYEQKVRWVLKDIADCRFLIVDWMFPDPVNPQ